MDKELAEACARSVTYEPYGYATNVLIRAFESMTPEEADSVLRHLGRWVEKTAGGDWPECPELDAALNPEAA